MKIVSIVGARPQFIKAAMLCRAIKKQGALQEVIVHTGQHYDQNMSRVFFEDMEIPEPNYNLGIGSGGHGIQTARMLEGLEKVYLREKPDLIIVYGDTNSTLAGALAAVKMHIPVAHVEAGLRSFNRQMPEEINRILTDHISDLLFAPTDTALINLKKEGISEGRCYLVGDVMYDAAIFYGQKADQVSNILNRIGLKHKNYLLATIHRAENTDNMDRLEAITSRILEVAEEMMVVWPLHPRTKAALINDSIYQRIKAQESLIEIDPVGYLDMIMLEKNARLIATDSGGVQKEAYFYKVPCLVFRNETEWIELVQAGWVKTIMPDDLNITLINEFIGKNNFMKNNQQTRFYGKGEASIRIVEIINDLMKQRMFENHCKGPA